MLPSDFLGNCKQSIILYHRGSGMGVNVVYIQEPNSLKSPKFPQISSQNKNM